MVYRKRSSKVTSATLVFSLIMVGQIWLRRYFDFWKAKA